MQKTHLDFDGESATSPRSNPAKKLSPTDPGLVFFRPSGILFLETGGKNFYTEEKNAIDQPTSSLTFFRSSQQSEAPVYVCETKQNDDGKLVRQRCTEKRQQQKKLFCLGGLGKTRRVLGYTIRSNSKKPFRTETAKRNFCSESLGQSAAKALMTTTTRSNDVFP